MLQPGTIVAVSLSYLAVLFAIAWWGDRRADQGRSVIANPTMYSLSLAVYCTSWTFYGSVGRAAGSGVGFLPIYLGPTLIALLWPLILRKMVRISKAHRITSIADFIASRYGKSQLLGGLVTIIAIIGVAPYIGLQLKAVATTTQLLFDYPQVQTSTGAAPLWLDVSFYIALTMAAFTIVFGTRHLDATERHEGMVAAIAFESVIKLLAFAAVGIYVTYYLFDGFGDLFSRAMEHPELRSLMTMADGVGGYQPWFTLTILSMLAVLFLPRQFQVAVVENVDERHIDRAMWMFPLYLLLINIFVLPIAFGGLIHFSGSGVHADTFVLTLPMDQQNTGLVLFAFIGGLSAATGMIIVETIALSTMVSNDLVMPALFRIKRLRLDERADLSSMLLMIRRGAILLIILLGYLYFRLAGEARTLVSLGLISFAAVAQFAPAMLGGMFWRGATRRGALAGLLCGFAFWVYTLLLPSFAKAGWLPAEFLEQGLLGLSWLKPTALFGLEGLGDISHALFWSLFFNIGAYVWVSLSTTHNVRESTQAALFVDVFQRAGQLAPARLWRGNTSMQELRALLGRFLGPDKAYLALTKYARERGYRTPADLEPDADTIHHCERLLAGAIGGASARVMMASAVQEDALTMDEVMEILDEASQVIVYSKQLEEKSRELEEATSELRAANERLTELDKLKDDFVSTVSHELRTPLTSIRAFSEILRDNPELETDQRTKYLTVIVSETERLTRLINQILDLSKMESDRTDWHDSELDMVEVVESSITTTSSLFDEQNVTLETDLRPVPPTVADRDRIVQVVVNLLSNAVKFCDPEQGRVSVVVRPESDHIEVQVMDNGAGVPDEDKGMIFEKFRQSGDTLTDKPQGTGLGLPISQQIVEHYGGHLSVEDAPGGGSIFRVEFPYRELETEPDEASTENEGRGL